MPSIGKIPCSSSIVNVSCGECIERGGRGEASVKDDRFWIVLGLRSALGPIPQGRAFPHP
jgi:hypothetical protein